MRRVRAHQPGWQGLSPASRWPLARTRVQHGTRARVRLELESGNAPLVAEGKHAERLRRDRRHHDPSWDLSSWGISPEYVGPGSKPQIAGLAIGGTIKALSTCWPVPRPYSLACGGLSQKWRQGQEETTLTPPKAEAASWASVFVLNAPMRPSPRWFSRTMSPNSTCPPRPLEGWRKPAQPY